MSLHDTRNTATSSASSSSTEPRSSHRMQLHGSKLFCVCVFHLACEILNTIHQTQCSDLYSFVYLPFRNVAEVHYHLRVVNCLRSQLENNTTTTP